MPKKIKSRNNSVQNELKKANDFAKPKNSTNSSKSLNINQKCKTFCINMISTNEYFRGNLSPLQGGSCYIINIDTNKTTLIKSAENLSQTSFQFNKVSNNEYMRQLNQCLKYNAKVDNMDLYKTNIDLQSAINDEEIIKQKKQTIA